jgi:U32 family peptidase
MRPASSRKAATEIRLFGEVDFSRIHPGDKVWKTSDPELDRALCAKVSPGSAPHFQRPIDLEVHGRAGEPLTVIGRDEEGRVVEVRSTLPLAVAQNQPLTEERLREQLGRLGGTPFRLGQLYNKLEGGVILPMSELNRLRRDLVSQFEEFGRGPVAGNCAKRGPRQIVRARRDQRRAAAGGVGANDAAIGGCAGLASLPRSIANSRTQKISRGVARFRAAQHSGGPRSEIFVAPPRIFKTGEEWIQKQVRSCEADGWLVRNYDDLRFYAGGRRVGDFSLNVANG